MSSKNIVNEDFKISKEHWESKNGHDAIVVWLTGLSGSGKTTLAKYIVSHYFSTDKRVVSLDGDNMRTGLCSNLGFSKEDRNENIRRIGETAKLLFNLGNIVICSFISPSKEQRASVSNMLPDGSFLEVFVDCPLQICEERDVKGLYKKAREGKILDFTGISSKYEAPEHPGLAIQTDKYSIEESAKKIINEIDIRIDQNRQK